MSSKPLLLRCSSIRFERIRRALLQQRLLSDAPQTRRGQPARSLMQSVRTVLPYGCHFLDNTANHIIGLRNMRGYGEMLAVHGESTAHQSMALIQWSGHHRSDGEGGRVLFISILAVSPLRRGIDMGSAGKYRSSTTLREARPAGPPFARARAAILRASSS